MTALPPDSEPPNTPASAQTSAAISDRTAGRNLMPRAIVTFVAVALFIAGFVATAVYLGVQIFT